jgi:hypothetical protein
MVNAPVLLAQRAGKVFPVESVPLLPRVISTNPVDSYSHFMMEKSA